MALSQKQKRYSQKTLDGVSQRSLGSDKHSGSGRSLDISEPNVESGGMVL